MYAFIKEYKKLSIERILIFFKIVFNCLERQWASDMEWALDMEELTAQDMHKWIALYSTYTIWQCWALQYEVPHFRTIRSVILRTEAMKSNFVLVHTFFENRSQRWNYKFYHKHRHLPNYVYLSKALLLKNDYSQLVLNPRRSKLWERWEFLYFEGNPSFLDGT